MARASDRTGREASVRALQREMVETRRAIHAYPELGYKETRTAKMVQGRLRELGMRPRALAGTGVVAEIDSRRPGRRLMLRADMDALPIVEATGFDFASRNRGVMHACGHDLHVAILLGVARLLRQTPPARGIVRICFQPAEEGLNGASAMIEAGVLEGVDAALGFHVWQSLPVGKAAALTGPAMAAVDEIHIAVEGKGAHAASPHEGVDPIVVASHLIVALQTIVSRGLDPFDTAVVTIGKVEGGSAFNIIPERVDLVGTVRTFKKATHDRVRRRIGEIVTSVCEAFGARGTLDYRASNPATVNAPEMAEFMRGVIRDVLGARALASPTPTMGGEDFAFFAERVPSCYAFVGSAPGRGAVFQHHHARFNPDEAALEIGARLMSEAARRWLSEAGEPTAR